jgi:CRP/FNR family transcriptional regulator
MALTRSGQYPMALGALEPRLIQVKACDLDMAYANNLEPVQFVGCVRPMATSWIDFFPGLAHLESPVRSSLQSAARMIDLPAERVIFRPGDECRHYLLVIDGCVRVQMTAESGREVTLYRVESGQSCILTTVCLLAREPYSAEGIVEMPVNALAVPSLAFREQLDRSAVLREFVFAGYGARMAGLMALVEEVCFGRVDVRLARLLSSRTGPGGIVTATHEVLAHELGTAREVISRQLKEFERCGLVHVGRGHVDIVDPTALTRLTDEHV